MADDALAPKLANDDDARKSSNVSVILLDDMAHGCICMLMIISEHFTRRFDRQIRAYT